MRSPLAVAAFLLWAGLIAGTYYVVQKPGLVFAFAGLAGTAWMFLVAALLLFNAYGIGTRVLAWLGLESAEPADRLIFASGLGLGALGLLGLGFSAAGLAGTTILSIFQLGLAVLLVAGRVPAKLGNDLKGLAAQWNLSFSKFSLPAKLAIALPWAFALLLTLVPPFEAFDALLYHLEQPARILEDGGLRPLNIAPFWFPSLVQSTYLWALALESERAAQLLHLVWGVLSALLVWRWAVRTWSVDIGRRVLLLFAAVPSLPMLASWPYADMALIFYATATFYALSSYEPTGVRSWMSAAGVMAGLAMGVKYTSFAVPVTAGLLILFWYRHQPSNALWQGLRFGALAIAIALPWYARNALLMGNPFYPFLFGGRYWDDFLGRWYADAGTGIGWNAVEIVLLPMNAVLGHRDATFFDGRLGPLYLIMAPFGLWILLARARLGLDRVRSLQAIGLFAVLSFAAWTLGVINTSSLWQTRLLLPALIPFAIPTALGWQSLQRFDSSRLRASFLANALIAIVVALTLFDTSIFVLQRNPLAVGLGAQSRGQYVARVNPSYAGLIESMENLPPDARVYSLFEPRSYGLPRPTQPDAINYNFAHDLHLHGSPASVIGYWKSEGYTHIVVSERGYQFLVENASARLTPARQAALRETLGALDFVVQTPDRVYAIYRIP